MKIDLKKKLIGVDGIKALPNPDNGKDLTLRDVCINAILQPRKDATGKQKAEAYELFLKIRDAGNEIDLSVEQVAQIKKSIGEIYAPLISGQAWAILDK